MDLSVRMRSMLHLTLEQEYGRAQLWTGLEKNSGDPLRVAYVGDAKAYQMQTPEYLQQKLFCPEGFSVEEVAQVAPRKEREVAESLAGQADMVIVEGNDSLRWRPKTGEWRASPTSIHMVLKLNRFQDWTEIEKAMQLQKRKIKTAHRNGLSLEVSKSDTDFDLFYNRMYVPMMQERHPGYGVIHTRDSAYGQFRNGLLMLVRNENGEAIGGGLFNTTKRSAFLLHTGLLDGDTCWYEHGASSALYYHSIQWFYNNKFWLYNAGGCRAFASDGLYEFKRRWGMQPTKDLWNPRRWLFWVPSGSSAAMQWLHSLEILSNGAA
jgi:hypothetical protein